MNKKNTIIVIDNSLDTTGAFKAVLRNIEDLKTDFDFVFVIPYKSTNAGTLEELGIQYHKFHMIEISKRLGDLLLYIPFLIFNAVRLRSIIQKYDCHIVHVNDMYNMVGVLGKLFKKFTLITHVRRMPESFPTVFYRIWVKAHNCFSDIILAVSKANMQSFKDHKNAIVLYDKTIDYERHDSFEVIERSKLKLLYLANFTKGKGQEHALEIAKRLKKKGNTDFIMNFYGGHFGLAKNQLFKQELIKMSLEWELDNFVKFHDKTNDPEQVMKAHDIIVNLSDSESFSNVSLEALYFGIPLIATNVGGTSEMFETGKSGILVEKGDYDKIVHYLSLLLTSNEFREELSVNGKKFVREKFGYNQTSGLLKTIYSNA